ncbi:hypothetical protein H0X32_02340 [Patescibacteria group bacterium]|nr:hypothetical protein [Patescibacteria group bacterium]
MKQLLTGIILILVLGIGAFFYRNQIEHPGTTFPSVVPPTSSTGATACTDEAKICPDGTAVGRTGSNCAFTPCLPPNVEVSFGSTTLSFVLPSGYTKNTAGGDSAFVASYLQSSVSPDSASAITIHRYAIPEGGSASQVMLQNTTLDPSGIQATSTSQFKQVSEGQNTFSAIQIGRFEGQVQTAYYLTRMNDVLRFDITERNVQNWTDPNFNASSLPQHQAFLQMLATLQVSS